MSWLVSLWRSHSIVGIGFVTWHDSPRLSDGVFLVGNVGREGQMLKEIVVPAWPIESVASSFHAVV